MNNEPETRAYSDPQLGNMAQVDRPATELEDYAQQLSTVLVGLERATLQYDNMLNRLRGPQPSTGADQVNKQAEPNSTMARLHSLMDGLLATSSKLNNLADDLNGII